MSGYTRSREEIKTGAPVYLFMDARTQKMISVRLLPFNRADTWLREANRAFALNPEFDALSKKVVQIESYVFEAERQAAAADSKAERDTAKECSRVFSQRLEAATNDLIASARNRMDGIIRVLALYDPDVLSRRALVAAEVSDEQLQEALMRLAFFNNSLCRLVDCTAALCYTAQEKLKPIGPFARFVARVRKLNG